MMKLFMCVFRMHIYNESLQYIQYTQKQETANIH